MLNLNPSLQLFFKYQSLGNDFIVFDWYENSEEHTQQMLSGPSWPQRVIRLCDRHTGIGADGILIIMQKNQKSFMRIFNADGTEAENCLNGLRCVAQHLGTYHKFSGYFAIGIGNKEVFCTVTGLGVSTIIPFVQYQQPHELSFSGGILQGHQADAGNPHFIVFQEKTCAWLYQYGKELESHADFPKKSNISFVWKRECDYVVLTFERGCGITQACSSAASAILKTLSVLNKIQLNENIKLNFLGGAVSGFIDDQNRVVLQAQAHEVFSGFIALF